MDLSIVIFFMKGKIVIMTNLERIKAMSVEDMVKAILGGISSDPCDYCPHDGYACFGAHCGEKADCDIVADWLNSEVKK